MIGLNQLKRLSDNNSIRTNKFKIFFRNLNSKILVTDYDLEGNCNYAFPLVLKNRNIKKIEIY